MTNITPINGGQQDSRPLGWLARGLEAALKSRTSDDRVMVTLGRAEAMQLVRMIDEANGDEGHTG